jgi:hypothetical protein
MALAIVLLFLNGSLNAGLEDCMAVPVCSFIIVQNYLKLLEIEYAIDMLLSVHIFVTQKYSKWNPKKIQIQV